MSLKKISTVLLNDCVLTLFKKKYWKILKINSKNMSLKIKKFCLFKLRKNVYFKFILLISLSLSQNSIFTHLRDKIKQSIKVFFLFNKVLSSFSSDVL